MTRSVNDASGGDQAGGFEAGGLDAAVYAELKSAAQALLARRQPSVSLTPTSLVHDAFLRLSSSSVGVGRWRSEAHFRAAAAKAMRHILVDRARRRGADKHGAGWTRVTLSVVGEEPMEVDLEALNAALDELAAIDPRGAEVVQMRFLAGLTAEDIAQVLEVSVRTVERDWRAARAWLLEALAAE